MIKEKYQQLLLHAKFGGITVIDDTQSLSTSKKKKKEKSNKKMVRYYSTYLSGLSIPVEQFLKQDIEDIKIIKNLDGLVEYYSDTKLKKIKSLEYFNNTFRLIKRDKATANKPLEKMAIQIINDKNLPFLLKSLKTSYNRTFRIVTSIENNPVSFNKELLNKLEQKISNITGLKVHRSNPDFQIWLLYRSEGYVYFSIRLTKIRKEDKKREKGEIRPQLASILVRLSEPKEEELFLDPFCGSGAIPISRVAMSKKGLIIASDINEETITKLKSKVKKLKLSKKIVVRVSDALELSRYDNCSIHKIVTDPPWGYFEGKMIKGDYYEKMLIELIRVVKTHGLIIILVGQEILFQSVIKLFENQVTLIEKYSVLVSGKKATIFKLKKNK